MSTEVSSAFEPIETAPADDDAALIARVAGGDREAMAMIVMRHQAMLLRTAARLLHDGSRAEDVVQEAFIRAYQHARGFDPSARVSTWLYRIVCNLCVDEIRRLARRPRADAAPSCPRNSEDGIQQMLERERAERVAAAVARLPERQRIAVVLHRYEGLSMREVAACLDWSESAVESCLVRAYARLRGELADLMPPKRPQENPATFVSPEESDT